MTLSDFVSSRRWADDIEAATGLDGLVPDRPGYIYEGDGTAWIASTDVEGEFVADLFGGGQCHGTLAECEYVVFESMRSFWEDAEEPSELASSFLNWAEREQFASQIRVRWGFDS